MLKTFKDAFNAVKSRRNDTGAMLAESLVAIAIAAIILTAAAVAVITGLNTQASSEYRDRGVQLVREQIEIARSLDYDEVALLESEFNTAQNNNPEAYQESPLLGTPIFTTNTKLKPWQEKELGDYKYSVRTDVTWYEGTTGDSKAKLITATAYWKEKGELRTSTMTWIRTPSVDEASPDGITVEGGVEINEPFNLSHFYNTLGDKITLQWDFNGEDLRVGDLYFEIYLGSSTNQSLVGVVPGVSRSAHNITAGDATHAYVKAVYLDASASSALHKLNPPDPVTVPASPTITARQLPGTTKAEFKFSPVTGATSYAARWSYNDGSQHQLGTVLPNTAWISEEYPQGGEVKYSVQAINAAGSSANRTATVNIIPKPKTPEFSDITQNGSTITTRFNSVEHATSYVVEYQINNGAWSRISTPLPNQNVSVNNLSGGDTVNFRVQATSDISGDSDWGTTSYTVVPPPEVPEITIAEQRPVGGVFLFEPSDYSDKYEAQIRLGSGNWQNIAFNTPEAEYVHNWSGTNEYNLGFRVRGVSDVSGTSAWSTETITLLPPPPAPQFRNINQSGANVTFTFETVARAEGYYGEYKTDVMDEWQTLPLGNPGVLVSLDNVAEDAETLEMRIKTVNDKTGDSDWRYNTTLLGKSPNQVEFVTDEQKPSTNNAIFKFSPATNATSYIVERRIDEGNWTRITASPNQDITIAGNNKMGQVIELRVKAVNSYGESDWVGAAVEMLAKPDTPKLMFPDLPTYTHNYHQGSSGWMTTLYYSIPEGTDTTEVQYALIDANGNQGGWNNVTNTNAHHDIEYVYPEGGNVEGEGEGEQYAVFNFSRSFKNSSGTYNYVFRVRAVNDFGASDWGELRHPTFGTVHGDTAVPTRPKVTITQSYEMLNISTEFDAARASRVEVRYRPEYLPQSNDRLVYSLNNSQSNMTSSVPVFDSSNTDYIVTIDVYNLNGVKTTYYERYSFLGTESKPPVIKSVSRMGGVQEPFENVSIDNTAAIPSATVDLYVEVEAPAGISPKGNDLYVFEIDGKKVPNSDVYYIASTPSNGTTRGTTFFRISWDYKLDNQEKRNINITAKLGTAGKASDPYTYLLINATVMGAMSWTEDYSPPAPYIHIIVGPPYGTNTFGAATAISDTLVPTSRFHTAKYATHHPFDGYYTWGDLVPQATVNTSLNSHRLSTPVSLGSQERRGIEVQSYMSKVGPIVKSKVTSKTAATWSRTGSTRVNQVNDFDVEFFTVPDYKENPTGSSIARGNPSFHQILIRLKGLNGSTAQGTVRPSSYKISYESPEHNAKGEVTVTAGSIGGYEGHGEKKIQVPNYQTSSTIMSNNTVRGQRIDIEIVASRAGGGYTPSNPTKKTVYAPARSYLQVESDSIARSTQATPVFSDGTGVVQVNTTNVGYNPHFEKFEVKYWFGSESNAKYTTLHAGPGGRTGKDWYFAYEGARANISKSGTTTMKYKIRPVDNDPAFEVDTPNGKVMLMDKWTSIANTISLILPDGSATDERKGLTGADAQLYFNQRKVTPSSNNSQATVALSAIGVRASETKLQKPQRVEQVWELVEKSGNKVVNSHSILGIASNYNQTVTFTQILGSNANSNLYYKRHRVIEHYLDGTRMYSEWTNVGK